MALTVKIVRQAETEIRRIYPGLDVEDSEQFDEAVQELLFSWQRENAEDQAASCFLMFDTPFIENGRNNCNDWGTGEGQFHGRM